jgi:hypothetical protein
MILLTKYTEDETHFVNLLGHFPGVEPIQQLIGGAEEEEEEEKKKKE